eukprot:scaffold9768_cov130-Isochrysis_galbana.AAC.1
MTSCRYVAPARSIPCGGGNHTESWQGRRGPRQIRRRISYTRYAASDGTVHSREHTNYRSKPPAS